jgi:hypothetical protein
VQPGWQLDTPQHAFVTQMAVALDAWQSASTLHVLASGASPHPVAHAVRWALACERHTSPASPQSASEWHEPAGYVRLVDAPHATARTQAIGKDARRCTRSSYRIAGTEAGTASPARRAHSRSTITA